MNHKCYQLCLQVVPECSSVSYNLAFLAWGSSAFPWYGTGTFFFQSRSSLNTFSSPAWTAANPGAQSQSLSFVLSIPRTFWRKNPQKPAQTFCEGKGYNTCLSLTSHSTLLLTYKMLVVLKCRTGIIPTSRCFFCIRRECHCFRQTMSSCCKWVLRTSVLPFWVYQNELVHIGSWTIHVFFLKSVTLNSTHWKKLYISMIWTCLYSLLFAFCMGKHGEENSVYPRLSGVFACLAFSNCVYWSARQIISNWSSGF